MLNTAIIAIIVVFGFVDLEDKVLIAFVGSGPVEKSFDVVEEALVEPSLEVLHAS
jgi:hypothetical protein